MKWMKWAEMAIIPVTLVFVSTLVLVDRGTETSVNLPDREPDKVSGQIPDFASYTNVQEKKKAFFEFMLPMIRKANASIKNERKKAKELLNKRVEGKDLSQKERQALTQLFNKYQLGAPESFTVKSIRRLLNRVDIVPESLVLAQAANESAWGTSRFAKRANNFFGIWCYVPGCGLTPSRRDADKHHEVRKYESIQAGVNHYLKIINTQRAYTELRQIRAELRNENNINGTALAEGLMRYSERGHEYVDEIKQMIRYNKLHQYTIDHSA